MAKYSVILRMPGGGTAIIHGSKPMTACICQARVSAFLWDFPVGAGRTCDAPLCDDCRTNKGPELDYCPDHADRGAGQERML